MPKLKNKNTNKNKNNIRITINNNSSTSKRKRKSGGKGKQSSSTSVNPMPTIIQMHHHTPPATQSQIADNSYGIGMAEKIDALAGGLTRVFERIETQQQDNYSRDKNEAFLQKQLKNRENELKVIAAHKNPTNISNHAPPLQQPVIAPTMDQIPPPTEPLASGSVSSSKSSYLGSTMNSQPRSEQISTIFSDKSSYLGSTMNSEPPKQRPLDIHSVGSGFDGSLNSYHSPTPLKPKQLINVPDYNMDQQNYFSVLGSDDMSEITAQTNPMHKTPLLDKQAKENNERFKWHGLKHKLLMKKVEKKRDKMEYNKEYYENKTKKLDTMMNTYQNKKYLEGAVSDLKSAVGDKILKGPISKTLG
jgi:hypothetical protein